MQVFADKAAGWLFYAAVGVAILTAVAWTLAVGLSVEVIRRIATVLMVACPHALRLAIHSASSKSSSSAGQAMAR